MIWVWCGVAIMNGQIVNVLTNCLHGKEAELCLANSRNNRVTTKKYIGYFNSIHSTHPWRPRYTLLFLSRGFGKSFTVTRHGAKYFAKYLSKVQVL